MQNHEGLTPTERELAAALAGLKPAGTSLNRDQVMFAAGRASTRRNNRLWQSLASLLAVVLLISLVSRPKPAPSDVAPGPAIANSQVKPASRTIEPVDPARLDAYRQFVRTRRAVLNRGIEGLRSSPTRRTRPSEPPLTRDSIEDLLSSP